MCGDIKSFFCYKSSGGRKWKLEMVSQSGKMQMSYIGMFDLLTPAVPGEFPWPILCTGCCVRPHVTPVAKQAGAIRNPQPTPPERTGHWTLRQVAIFAHLKYTHLANWGRGGLGDRGRTPWCSCGPRRKIRPGSFAAGEGVGAVLAGGCLAAAALLSLKGGRDRICSKLQEADEVLICWVAVSLGPCSQ